VVAFTEAHRDCGRITGGADPPAGGRYRACYFADEDRFGLDSADPPAGGRYRAWARCGGCDAGWERWITEEEAILDLVLTTFPVAQN
jgi:hypothetical protein